MDFFTILQNAKDEGKVFEILVEGYSKHLTGYTYEGGRNGIIVISYNHQKKYVDVKRIIDINVYDSI